MPMFSPSSGNSEIESEGFFVEPHPVQHRRELTRYGDTGFVHAGALGDLLAPDLDGQGSPEARDHHRRGLEQELACRSVSPHFEIRPITFTSPD